MEKSSSNCISGGVGFEYQFFVKDMGLSFPTNLLISCNLKTHLSEAEDKESESDFSGKKTKKKQKKTKQNKKQKTKNKNKNKNKNSSFFLEIAQAVLVEVFCSIFIFCKSKSICSTFSIVLV